MSYEIDFELRCAIVYEFLSGKSVRTIVELLHHESWEASITPTPANIDAVPLTPLVEQAIREEIGWITAGRNAWRDYIR